MRELNTNEIETVSGGMSLEDGGVALMTIGIAGVTTGVGAVAFVIGAAMLGGSVIYSNSSDGEDSEKKVYTGRISRTAR